MIAAAYDWSGFYIGLNGGGASSRKCNASLQPLLPGATNRSKIDAVGLFTGQIGYAVNNVLFYVKGGAIAVNDKYEGVVTATGAVFDSASETRWGGAVGVGLDYGVTPTIVLGIDYIHGFMGSRDITLTIPVGGVFSRTDRIRQDIDMVTARISYKFGGPVIAKY